ncbi:response regulator receiver modulated diguanylate cyclase/phosphodiesterase [Thioalkalivibrio nitratireducens DSM 14787]|uniref:Response regulator receiver modulated diguanylate cyclase/phosphodiesterase n=1 Tax=Thioalkalivibrio nitratireducens (strain DSM 14787 / UNIQEM 213 / ALEN2) TaxID=1255043 RepID=L0DVX3_THIND|nr:response regulator receiver modulated diguanylate cyclase/phosphodiesterase [Thioalkalivibrio nitratireducens DSM 14787]
MDELIERWHITRSRACPTGDLKELRALTQVLVGNLTGSGLIRLSTLTRRIDERLRFFLNTDTCPQRHEQETLGTLFAGLRNTMNQEFYEHGLRPSGSGAGMLGPTPEDPSEPSEDAAENAPLIYFLRQDQSDTASFIREIAALGLPVRDFVHLDPLRTALTNRAPSAVLIHVPSDATPYAALTATRALRHSMHPTIPWAWILDRDDARTRLEAVRSGADACFCRSMAGTDLVDRLHDLMHALRGDPYQVLVIDPDPAEAVAPFSAAWNEAAFALKITADPFEAVDIATLHRPEAIVAALRFPGLDGIELGRMLRQADPGLPPPILLRGDAEAIAMDLERIHAEGLGLLPGSEPPERLVQRVCAHAQQHRNNAARLRSISRIDLPTGWYNRQYFEALVARSLTEKKPASGTEVLLYAEIHNGSESSCAGAVGVATRPELPMERVQRLRAVLAPDDVVGRYGATGLAILARRPDVGYIQAFAQSVQATLASPRAQDPEEDSGINASVGVVPLRGSNATALLNDAVELADRARDQHGDGIRLADELGVPPLDPDQRNHWTRVIHGAVNDQRLFLVYQPVASLLAADSTQRFEALLRMRDPSGHILLPGRFVGMAERLGLIRLIDRWVLAGAAAILAQHQQAHPEAVLFMKVSAGSILDPGFAPWIGETLGRLPLRPGGLVLQIREADARTHYEPARQLVRRLRQLGIQVAIEHFGNHSDSIALLREFQPEFMKLDRSFTRELGTRPEQIRALEHLMQQARFLGVKTIAAYVEDASSLAILWQQHPDLIQGNFLKQPDPQLQYDILL